MRDRFSSRRRSNARRFRKHFFRTRCLVLTQQNDPVRVSVDGSGYAEISSGVEPWSQLMNCLRCHGLMVTLRMEDAGGSSLCFSGWQCLMCGEVIDSVITANRKELHGQTGSRSRARYGVSLVQRSGPYPGDGTPWGPEKGSGS